MWRRSSLLLQQPEVQEESEVQEVVDLDSYTFRFCTCPILDSVTDRFPSHLVVLALPEVKRPYLVESPTVESPPPDAAECATREARRRYASRHNQRVREAREHAKAQARVTPRWSPRFRPY